MNFLRKFLLYFQVLLLFIKRQGKLLVILTAALAVFFGGLFLLRDKFLKPVLSEGLVGTYTDHDLPPAVTNLLSQSLIELDSAGLPKAKLAASWQSSSDAKVYTLKLKDNLYWSDGTKLRPQDIDFPLPDVEIKTVDDSTVEFKLADSFSPFPTLLTKPVFKKNSFIGTGPYQIKGIQRDQVFVKKLTLQSFKKEVPDIVIRFYPNERIAQTALKLGEVQSLLGVNDLSRVQEDKLKVLSKTNYQQLVTIFYNTKDSQLSDENLRLALSFGAPSVKGEAEAKTSIPPLSFAFKGDVRDYLDNEEQAKTSLKKAHLQDKITLTATTSLQTVGEQVVTAWKKLGINAVLRIESGIPQNFQALLIAQNIPADPDQYSLWHSTQLQTNLTKYSSPRIDKDLEDGRKTVDLEVRKQKYQDFQKVLLDHAPATFLYFPKYNVIYRSKVEGMLNKIIKLQLPRLFGD